MEERIIHGEDGVTYILGVPLFSSEMYKWEPGQSIEDLSTFSFMNTKFSLLIYPNGASTEDSGFLSVYLKNESSRDILVDCSVSINNGQQGFTMTEAFIKAKKAVGDPKFYDQYNGDEYYNCDPEIVCTIRTVTLTIQEENSTDESHYELTRKNASEMKDLKEILTQSLRLQEMQLRVLNNRLKNMEIRQQDGKIEKISSQIQSLHAEFKMHCPEELSRFLSDKPKPNEICDI